MIQDLVINLPKDHLKHMKVFLGRNLHCSKDVDRVIILISPKLNIGKIYLKFKYYSTLNVNLIY